MIRHGSKLVLPITIGADGMTIQEVNPVANLDSHTV